MEAFHLGKKQGWRSHTNLQACNRSCGLQVQQFPAFFWGQEEDLLLQAPAHFSVWRMPPLPVLCLQPQPPHPRLLPLQSCTALTCPWLRGVAVSLQTSMPGHLLQWVLSEDWRQTDAPVKNHRIIWLERDTSWSSSPTPCNEQAHLQLDFESS